MSKSSKKGKPSALAKKPILVPIDFSADSVAAAHWACDIAEKAGAAVILLHVVHDPAEAPGFYRKVKKSELRPMEDVAQTMMDDFVAENVAPRCSKRLLKRMGTKVVSGLPVSRILKFAAKVDAGMIVLGRRGRSRIESLLVGSKAEHVVQLSKVPVVVVKAEQGE